MLEEDPMLVNAPHYEKAEKILNSDLYKCFEKLPKPAVHHVHLTGCVDPDFLVKLTYYRYVFYSEKDNMFVVNQNGCEKPGYMKVNALR